MAAAWNQKRSKDTVPRAGEVYLELIPMGNSLKVSAIDAATGVEVSVVGPKLGHEEDLKRIAVRKLRNRLASRG